MSQFEKVRVALISEYCSPAVDKMNRAAALAALAEIERERDELRANIKAIRVEIERAGFVGAPDDVASVHAMANTTIDMREPTETLHCAFQMWFWVSRCGKQSAR